MKRFYVVLLFLTICSVKANSQTWEKLFSGISTDVFRCVIEVPSGGYLVAGYTADSTVNDTDAYAVRLDAMGDTLWTYKYNGPMSKKDLFYKVINTSDGGFVFCGYTFSFTGISDDVLYLKLNSSGQLQWVKFFGGSGRDRAQDVIQTADGKYTIVGYTTSAPALYYDAFMLRVNTNGDTLWSKRYGAANYDDANSVQVLSDGGYILAGQSNNGTNGLDLFLVRTNSTGDTLWTKRFGTTQTDNIDCIRITAPGYIIAGSTNSLTTGDDGYIARLDTAGNIIWEKTYGGAFPDDFHRIEATTGGGFVACGTTTSSGPALPNMWMVRINVTGDTLWTRTFGGANHDHGYSGQQTSDGGYIIAGHTGSFGFNSEEAYVVKTDGSGNVSEHLTYTTVLAIVSPTASTCGSANTQIKLKLRNFGNQPVPNMPVTVEVTGSLNTTIPQTFSASSDTVTLTTTINTSAGGTYTFNCYTSNGNDVYPARNSMVGTFTINVTAANPTTTSASRCGNGTVNLSAAGTGTLYWFNAPVGGTSVTTGTAYSPNLSATTSYYVQSGLVCPSSRIPVTATINTVSANPVTTGDSRCGPGALELTATSADSIVWYNAPMGGSVVGIGDTLSLPSVLATTDYYALATNGICPSSRVVATAMVSSVAADPTTTSSQRCGAGQDTLHATSPDPVVWYDAPTGGTIVGNGHTFITLSLNSTTTFYAEADNGCVSNRIPATVTILTLPADPLTMQGQRCGPGTVNLTATASGPITWYDGSGNVVGTGSPLTTPSLTTTTVFYAETTDGTCPSHRAGTVAVVLALPHVNLGNDTTVGALSFPLDAGAGFPSYLWSTGETTQQISVTHIDTFCVVVTDASGCSNSDCIFVNLLTAIENVGDESAFSLYPNPASGIANIYFERNFTDVKVDVVSMTGEIVKHIEADHADLVSINLESFAKGIYLVRVTSTQVSALRKLVVE